MKIYIIITTLILLILSSCISFVKKNEFGKPRFKVSRFKVKANNNPSILSIIDTSSFYLNINNPSRPDTVPNGLKFYRNGKVAFLKNINLKNPETFNPKKASMGYYTLINNYILIESKTPLPSSSYRSNFKKILLQESSKDTIAIETIRSSTASGGITRYKRIKLGKKHLIYKPDW